MKTFTKIKIKQVIKDASLRFSLLFWLIALHSFFVGVALIVHPSRLMQVLGYGTITEHFFPAQGGVFHVLMSILYGLVALRLDQLRCLIYFSVIVKFSAVIFLFSYYIIADHIFIVLVSGIVDGAMAVAIIMANRSYKKQISEK